MAVRTISTRLAIEGEAQYKQSVASCNSELSLLKSNLALVESEFRGNANSMDALTAKGAALGAVYDKQLEKVADLEAALLNARNAVAVYAEKQDDLKSKIEASDRASAPASGYQTRSVSMDVTASSAGTVYAQPLYRDGKVFWADTSACRFIASNFILDQLRICQEKNGGKCELFSCEGMTKQAPSESLNLAYFYLCGDTSSFGPH